MGSLVLRVFGSVALAATFLFLGGSTVKADKPYLWLRPIPITRTQGAVLPLPPGNVAATYEVCPNKPNPLPAGTTLADAPINWTYGRVTAGASNASVPGVYAYVGTGVISSAYYIKWEASTVTVVAP